MNILNARQARNRRGRTRVTRAAFTVALAVGAVLTSTSTATAATDPGDGKGTVHTYSYSTTAQTNAYYVYTPPSYKSGDKWPLYVMLHGCGTTALQQMHSNLINPLADAQHFLVVYPDGNSLYPSICWRAFLGDPTSRIRGAGGDADIVAGITKATMASYNIDPERVYLMGMSSGGFQTSADAAAYPDLYAAVGVNAAGGYGMDASCAGLTDDVVSVYAQEAVAEMGTQARIIPFFSIGGTADPLGEQAAPGGCTRLAFEQWMATDNLIATNLGLNDTYKLDPKSTKNGMVTNGYAWTKSDFRDVSGCRVGERWIVDGMAHYWSGGSTNPAYATFTDPKGPSATNASWNFFRQYTKSTTDNRCTALHPSS